MLPDRASIEVRPGAAATARCRFRREAHVPKGGPDGGDGGRGGDVIAALRRLAARPAVLPPPRALPRRARRPRRRAPSATAPTARRWSSRVPPGTQVARWDGTRYDLVRARPGGRRSPAAGAGGRGNKRFATAVRQAPRLAERGLPGEEGWVELQLKLLADVGLVGLPNAGKSSLLARLTRAQPKVAAYPFTTLEPVLGTLDADDRQLVIADIPGLIEGASAGAGLGHDFLAHVERTRLLVHVLDLAPLDGSDPVANHAVIEHELAEHDPAARRAAAHARALEGRPRDAGGGRARRPPSGASASAATSRCSSPRARPAPGLDELPRELLRARPGGASRDAGGGRAARTSVAEFAGLPPGRARARSTSSASATARSAWSGEAVERLIARHDLENDEALAHVEHRLRRMGVIGALEAAGFEPGDDVEIGGVRLRARPGRCR